MENKSNTSRFSWFSTDGYHISKGVNSRKQMKFSSWWKAWVMSCSGPNILIDCKQEQDHTAAEGSSWGYSHLTAVWMSNCLYKGRIHLKEHFSYSKMPLISEANCLFVMNAVKNHSIQDFHICDFWHKGRNRVTDVWATPTKVRQQHSNLSHWKVQKSLKITATR